MKDYSKNTVVTVLAITIIIDLMGIGLIFPVMPSLLLDGHQIIFNNPVANFQNWHYAIALASWPLGLMIGCPILGELSDKYGRKKILSFSILISCLSYLVSAYAIYEHSYIIFIASRLVCGLAGGAFEIAQASVIDISDHKDKNKNICYIAMAGLLGFTLGPVITSLMASMHVNVSLPFIFAAVITMINFILIQIVMRKDLPKNPGLIVDLHNVYKTILFLVTDKRIRLAGFIFLLAQCSWGFYGQGVALLLTSVHEYSITSIGLFYAFMGVAIAMSGMMFLPQLFITFSKQKAFILFTTVSGICLIISALIGEVVLQWFLMLLISIAQLVTYTSLLMMISSSVSDKEQGKAMGAAGAGFGLAWFINDIILGHLTTISIKTPMMLGGISLIFTVILFVIAINVFRERVQ